jgi:hypothetical protein
MSTEEKKEKKENAAKQDESNPTTGKDILDLMGRDVGNLANSP